MNNGGLFALKKGRKGLDPNNNQNGVNSSEQKEKKRSPLPFIISIIAFILLAAACFLYLYFCTPLFPRGADTERETHTEAITQDVTEPVGTEPVETEPPLPDNPVSFAKQQEKNEEIYAWIYIPNTDVDYPILQSREDDLYYLRRGLDKNYDLGGVLFTQSCNRRDFSDPVTVIYGHNMTGYPAATSMFATLHNFEDAKFFKDNDTFYIYIPGHILTYKIVSAYKYDNRHIMNSFNFADPEVVREYFDGVMNPMSIPMNVREGVELKDDDRIVVLSTCMADNTYRFLVNGVLISDEKTK